MSNLKKKHLINLSILVYLVLLISVLQVSKPMVNVATGMGDAHVRVSMVVNHTIQNHGVWPPTFFYILKFFIDHFGIYMGPRIFGISFFVPLSVCVYLLSNKISGSSKTAILTSILFITSPFFSRYITFSLSELPFVLFVVLGMLFLLDYKNKKYLLISAIMFGIANLFRFDGLIFLPALLIYIYKKSKKITLCVPFVIIYLSYFIYYIIQNYLYSADFFYLINDYKNQNLGMYQPLKIFSLLYNPIFAWLYRFLSNFNIPLFILGVVSLVFHRKKLTSHENLLLSVSFSLIILLCILRVLAPSGWYPEEYLFLPILLIYFIFGTSISKFVSKTMISRLILIGIIILSLSKNYYFIVNKFKISEISNQLKNVNGNCLYVLNENNYPYDRDEVMFLGNKIKYVSVSEQYHTFENKDNYKCFILDKLDNNDKVAEYFLQSFECETYYKDGRYNLIRCP